ncbi:hypothetical protein DAPPUDRAFT_256013 [Daphnia pulex]|uniref:Uncharacterized protein n=1 Tax=Daphnia pulex TaxID=6669 RepID=E9HAI2_DAPPU|nr:hypothetical protein DAPPUDRAFT_256013 [Daphnia pulex]|eukprot:EFX71184.1 hypothetical protein DAPPUDRAFT_256013 [Daphnia pulex]
MLKQAVFSPPQMRLHPVIDDGLSILYPVAFKSSFCELDIFSFKSYESDPQKLVWVL